MKSINAFSKTVLLGGCIALASGTLHAETISQSAGVTVIRGTDDAATAAQRQTSRGRDGVVVYRGESMRAPASQPVAIAPVATTQVVSGQNLWLHDTATNTVTACSLRYDYYGNRTVSCSAP